MIRLVAADMDGTLLDASADVPPETMGLIRELADVGIRFSVSSGRRIDSLRETFAPVADAIDYISCNGTQVYAGAELVDRETLSRDAILRLSDLVDEFDCLHLTCAVGPTSYCLDRDQAKFDRFIEVHGSWTNYVQGRPAPGEQITLGVVICSDPAQIIDMAYLLNLEFGDDFVFQRTGDVAIDFTPKGVSKATGLTKLMRYHGISADEVLVWGDAMNDYDIMRTCGHPVAVGNALYVIQQIAERVIETNAEHGVQRDMRRLIDEAAAERSQA